MLELPLGKLTGVNKTGFARFWCITHVTLNSVIIGDIVLIFTGKPNKLRKIHNYLEKAENVISLHILSQNKIGKNHWHWFEPSGKSKSAIFGNFVLIATGKEDKLHSKMVLASQGKTVIKILWPAKFCFVYIMIKIIKVFTSSF